MRSIAEHIAAGRARKAILASTTLAVTIAVGAASASAAGPGSRTLWASPNGAHRLCLRAAPCSLSTAVALADRGDTVFALPGVYDGGVVLAKRVFLRGDDATIDAASSPTGTGVQITGPGGSGSSVEGFVIEDARFEGILVGTPPVAPSTTNGTAAGAGVPVTAVRIADNVLSGDGTGFGSDAGECFSTPAAPGDCGETIHLVSVTRSLVQDNVVAGNVGGILLTDEFGPTSGNVIRNNVSIDNTHDCGITLAGHSSAAVDPATSRPTGAAGVFHNLIEGNVSDDNGVAGQGAGIVLGGGAPDTGVYDNVLRGNTATGNGLSGIAIHQHFAGDLDGNRIEDNRLSDDNLDGDDDFSPADAQTTGILVASGPLPGLSLPASQAPGPITGTVIRGNRIGGVAVGIWTLGVDPAQTVIGGNAFAPGVLTPVSAH